MKAVDLYAGIGGWALGLKMAGVEVVSSFEWWSPASRTHQANLKARVVETDIRSMTFDLLPKVGSIDIVVGSPPCTQFSYSNRGGGGDVVDGLKDIYRFLEVVRFLKPKYWALENVPRVQKVLERELQVGGALVEFSDLFADAAVVIVDMSKFGLPQRRKRCVAGNFDPELLSAYSSRASLNTLGNVLRALKTNRDPNYHSDTFEIVTDNEKEEPLSWEEIRFNRDMKEAHPIYNGMAFPEPLNRPSRTVTATCTRVSRESLVVQDKKGASFRRLSVRERASLQGFPVQYQFMGNSHAEKLKMIGNAIPPTFTYFLAEAFKGTRPEVLTLPHEIDANALLEVAKPIKTRPDSSGQAYPDDRRFRFVVPSLRFKSGTRFELANSDGADCWRIAYYFGDSKRIYRHDFVGSELKAIVSRLSRSKRDGIELIKEKMTPIASGLTSKNLQAVWSRKSEGRHPFELLDDMGSIAEEAIEIINLSEEELSAVQAWLSSTLFTDRVVIGQQKLKRLLVPILVGAALSISFNELIDAKVRVRKAA